MADELDDLIKQRRKALQAPAAAPRDATDHIIAERRAALGRPASKYTPGEKFSTMAAQGATMGFAGKVLGAVDATNAMLPTALGGKSAPLSEFGPNYRKVRDKVLDIEQEGLAEHPVAGPVVELAGGVLASLPMAAATGVKALARGARAPLGARLATGAKVGAGYGAVAGAGHATGDVEDYARNMAGGAAVGGVVGAAAPEVVGLATKAGGRFLTAAGLRPTGRGAQEIAQDAATMRAPVGPQAGASPATEAAAGAPPAPTRGNRFRAAFGRGVEQTTGAESSKTLALREVGRRLELDNVTPADAVAYAVKNAKKPLAVMDLGGGNVAGLARTAKDVPGLGRRLIPDYLHGRSGGKDGATLQRVTKDFEDRIGLAPEDYYASLDDMTGKMKAEAATNYGKVRNTVVDDPEVLSLFSEPEWKGVHERIRTNARIGGKEKIPQLVSEEVIDGSLSKVQNPQSLGTLDKMKRHLDKVIEGKIEGGPLDKDMAFNMRGRLNTILDRMDELHPDYKTARAAYRGSAEGIESYEAGKAEFLKLDPRAINAKLSKMPERLRDLYRRGGYDALRTDKLGKMDDGANIGAWLEKNPDIRERVAALAKSPEEAAALRGDLGTERALGDRKNYILEGPNSAERLIEHASTVPRVTQLGNVARMIPGVGKLAGGLVDNSLTRRSAEQTGDVMGEVAKLMVQQGPDAMERLMAQIQALQAGDAAKAMGRTRTVGKVASLGANGPERKR